MNGSLNQYIVLVSISGVLNTCLGIYAFLKKSDFSGMKAFGWICFLSAFYTFSFGMELMGYTMQDIMFWIRLEYLAMPFIAPTNLVLILHYLGMETWITRRRLLLLFTVPALTTLMVWTNEVHHLFYRSVYMRPGEIKPLVDVIMGEWYIVHGCFTFGCMVVSLWLLLRNLVSVKRRTYRIQMLTLLVGTLLPMAGALLYLFERTPYGMDPVPIIMCLTSALYIGSIFSSGMLTVLPIAREAVFESMRDGILVLAPSGRIVDFNRAAAQMLPGINAAAIGRPFADYWPPSTETDCTFLLADHPDGQNGRDTGDTAIRHVVAVTRELVSPPDRFARYGGEEFILCLPGVSLEDAGLQAERIRLALCAHPILLGNELVVLTASFGVSARGTPGLTLEKLIAQADEAMYSSKHNGRNQVQLASSGSIQALHR